MKIVLASLLVFGAAGAIPSNTSTATDNATPVIVPVSYSSGSAGITK